MKTYKKDQTLVRGQVVEMVGWGLLYADNGFIRLPKVVSGPFFFSTRQHSYINPIPTGLFCTFWDPGGLRKPPM